jgi:O-antigen ligase
MTFAAPELRTRAFRLVLAGLALLVGLLAGIDPKMAIVAALGLLFVLGVVSDLAVGLALFAVVSFLDVLPAGGASVSFAKAAGLLLALAWLATLATRTQTENDFAGAHPMVTYLLILFVAWVGLSSLWAEQPANAFESLYRYALNLALFPIVYTAVRTGRHVNWVLAAFMAGAVVSALYGIVTPVPPTTGVDTARLSGAGLDPNQLAALLVASIALAGAFFAGGVKSTPGTRAAALAVIGFCLAGVLLSLSRGGLVALGVAMVTAVIFGGRWRMSALALLVVVAGSAYTYIAFFANPVERARITHPQGGTGRTDIWAVGWRMVEAHPVAGVGAGNFPVSSVHYLLKPGLIQRSDFIVDKPKVAHNLYLGVLAELGVVGLALFLSIIGFSLWCVISATHQFVRSKDRRMELLSRALFVALVALLAADFFLSEQFSKQLWLLLALGPALMAVSRREAREAEPEASAPQPTPPPRAEALAGQA